MPLPLEKNNRYPSKPLTMKPIYLNWKNSCTTIFALVFMLVLASCSESPKPDKPQMQNPPQKEDPKEDPGEEPEEVSHTSALEIDANFVPITGFSSRNVALQEDGKIIIDAYIPQDNGDTSVKIFRLHPNGDLDNTFDIDVDRSWKLGQVTGLFVLADGQILVGGSFIVDGKTAYIVRLSKDGSLDRTYGGIGYYSRNPPQLIRTADGKVFAIIPHDERIAGGFTQNYLIRINDDGSVDESFRFIFNGAGHIRSVVPLVDGKILVSGKFVYSRNGRNRYDLARLNDDGGHDESFNFPFEQRTNFNTPLSMTVDYEGRILIAGTFDRLTDLDVRDEIHDLNRIARINPEGSIDLSYKDPLVRIGRYVADIFSFSDNTLMIRSFDESTRREGSFYFFNENGGEEPGLSLPFPVTSIAQIFRESKEEDQYLFVGNIPVNGINYPLVRMRRK